MDNIMVNESRSKRNVFLRIVSFSWVKKSTLVEIIVILYISMFIYAALSKLSDYTLSREQLALMPLMTPVANIVIWFLPAIEILISLLLFLNQTRKIAFYAATILMTLFTLYIIYMMTYYPTLPCSCGGLLSALTWPGHLIFNGFYILLGISGITLLKTKDSGTKG